MLLLCPISVLLERAHAFDWGPWRVWVVIIHPIIPPSLQEQKHLPDFYDGTTTTQKKLLRTGVAGSFLLASLDGGSSLYKVTPYFYLLTLDGEIKTAPGQRYR